MKSSSEEPSIWYDKNVSLYQRFSKEMSDIIEKILRANKIPFHSINYRVKEKDSYLSKCQKDKYKNPVNEVMDVSGIRIIAYTNQDVANICNVIKKEFNIDPDNSGDKAEVLDDNKVGYLSVHYIAQLNESRTILPEYEEFEGLKSEIQVRTLLQHAWAEIEHDKNYKFSGVLPMDIKRRFHLVAGVLEMMDREFDNLSNDIEHHKDLIKADIDNDQLNIFIDSLSINGYLEQKFPDENFRSRFVGLTIIQELNAFGIYNLYQFANLFEHDLISIMKKYDSDLSYTGLIRFAMIVFDSNRYFNDVFGKAGEGFHISNKLYEMAKEFKIDLRPVVDASMNKAINIDITN